MLKRSELNILLGLVYMQKESEIKKLEEYKQWELDTQVIDTVKERIINLDNLYNKLKNMLIDTF